jgi:hypothetical protein
MRCIWLHRARRFAPCVAAMLAVGAAAHEAKAQTYPAQPYPGYPQPYPYPQSPVPTTPSAPPAPLPAYRAPSIIVAAPADGTPLPEDKPVAVLRFMSVEPTDPIDALSFSVAIDGKDRTALFQATQGEAWGPLAGSGETLAAGQHELAARICTSHGECGTAKATVTVVASASGLQVTAAKAAEAKQKKTKILDAVVQAVRVLFR